MRIPLVLILGDRSAATSDLVDATRGPMMSSVFSLIGQTLSDSPLPTYSELAQFRMVVLLAGNHYPPLPAQFQTALVQYVKEGGSVLMTPFIAWSVPHMGNRIIDEVVPVSAEAFDEKVVCEWRASQQEGLITHDFHDFRLVQTVEAARAKDKALVVLHEPMSSTPLLTAASFGMGTVVYLNASHHVCEESDLPVFRHDAFRIVVKASLGYLLSGPHHAEINAVFDFSASSFGMSEPSYPVKLPLNPSLADTLTDYESQLQFEGAFEVKQFIHSPRGGVITLKPREPEGATKRTVLPDLGHFLSVPKLAQLGICRLALRYHRHWPMTNDEKGRFLEQWSALFFSMIDGLSVVQSRLRGRSEEVDLMIRNESTHPFWARLESPILVECKNVSEKVGSSMVRDFVGKIEDMGASSGFLISPLGVSGTRTRDGKHVIRATRTRGITVIALSFDQIEWILSHTDIDHAVSDEYYKALGKD